MFLVIFECWEVEVNATEVPKICQIHLRWFSSLTISLLLISHSAYIKRVSGTSWDRISRWNITSFHMGKRMCALPPAKWEGFHKTGFPEERGVHFLCLSARCICCLDGWIFWAGESYCRRWWGREAPPPPSTFHYPDQSGGGKNSRSRKVWSNSEWRMRDEEMEGYLIGSSWTRDFPTPELCLWKHFQSALSGLSVWAPNRYK